MIADLLTGIGYTLFWFAIIMLELFAIMRVIKWLESYKGKTQ